MKIKKLFFVFVAFVIWGCGDDFLTREPLDVATDDTYWSSDNNFRTYSLSFYTSYFAGYGSGYTWGNYFSGQALNDDFAATNPSQFVSAVPSSGGGWTFTYVRKANMFIEKAIQSNLPSETKKHWIGVGRFFRALEYNDLVKTFGDVPFFSKSLTVEDSIELYKPRDNHGLVMDSVLNDLKFAAANVRVSDGNDQQMVNKWVVLAYMSRVMLNAASWEKYYYGNQAKATTYFEAAKWAANEVMNSGKFAVVDDYRGMFSSLSLTGNKEMILFRSYVSGQVTHALNSYNNKEAQTGMSRNLIESFLCTDGRPINLSSLYRGDRSISNVLTNRDPRLSAILVPEIRLNGVVGNYSTSGYSCHKFLNESTKEAPEGSGALNITDAPVIRYGEVLMNYVEAVAELGQLTQDDLNKTINLLRKRKINGNNTVFVKELQIIGGLPAVDGVTYDDPKRDQTVPSMIWEIRRERRVELALEGFRLGDLKRWKKLEYTDTQVNVSINRGAYIKKSDYDKLSKDIVLENGAAEGYIVPASKAVSQRLFTNERVYLNPLPLDQITLYKSLGKKLEQNPGWE